MYTGMWLGKLWKWTGSLARAQCQGDGTQENATRLWETAFGQPKWWILPHDRPTPDLESRAERVKKKVGQRLGSIRITLKALPTL